MEPKKLTLPITKEDVLRLNIGDMVSISGQIVTGRDRIHKFLFNKRPKKEDIPFDLEGTILYHVGPIIKKEDGEYKIISGGPTTSSRVEMYEAWVIENYGIRGVMGKGGMGKRTHTALKNFSCVYLNTIGGAGAYLADKIKKVKGGWMVEEFGATEAMWLLKVEEFPALVTMDAHGRSLHEDIEKKSLEELKKLLGI